MILGVDKSYIFFFIFILCFFEKNVSLLRCIGSIRLEFKNNKKDKAVLLPAETSSVNEFKIRNELS